MKNLKVLFLILFFHYCSYGQGYLTQVEINWNMLELPESDSLLNSLITKSDELSKKPSGFLEMQKGHSHVVNLNNDLLPDLIIYWTDYLNENFLQIFVNEGDSLRKVFEKYGQITLFNKRSPLSPLLINLNTIRYSSPPGLAEFTQLAISPNAEILVNNSIDYYQGTKFPDEFSLNVPFKVKNDKYRLRMTPEIDNGEGEPPLKSGNLIQELAKGDMGIALYEYKDEIGRIWWFAMLFNNIKKNPNFYTFVNTEDPMRINNVCFGWVSSRYLEY